MPPAKRMRIATAAAAALLALANPAVAFTEASGTHAGSSARAAPTFGRTLPPIGFVKFCGRRPEACAARPSGNVPPHLSARQWDLVSRVNNYVNAEVRPASDETVYGEAEHWDYPSARGDCEDYALLKQRYLEALGIPRSALLLTVVLDDLREGHAVLMLSTSEGDFILDNRSGGIRRWSDTGYLFLKRQSARDPRDWLALAPDPQRSANAVAAPASR